MSEDLNQAPVAEAPTAEAQAPMQEAMQARGNALNAAAQAKENLGRVAAGRKPPEIGPDGSVTTDLDRRMDEKFGSNSNQPTSVGGRVV